MRAQGADVKPGDFAENITVEGMDKAVVMVKDIVGMFAK